ncbi:hypothetical protein JNB62_14750 [Microbacterium jejuense]|uniref:DUF559 domain-containing protein n=1 Tax=Microbacterium jejuense TaxID=1263637 RepID=A0ABS7HRR7_9MICO|nr:hypothetical protein [Microbacterium jejuense]MBW9094946.1 hypothetical protein [Microbacterium jejuense]
MPRTSLPPQLGDRFVVADAIAAEVSPARLRASDLDAPFHGVRVRGDAATPDAVAFDSFGRPRGEHEIEHLMRALAYGARSSEFEFASHITAAILWGWPLPLRLVSGRAIDIAVAEPRRLPRSRGVRGHQVVGKVSVVREPRTGLLVSDPATTWAMLGRILADPYDLIAAGDAAVRTWRVAEPQTTIQALETATRRGRRVGIGQLRAALPRIRTRSASRPETYCRLTLVDAGLPEPELNFEVFEGNVRLGAVDLAYPAHRVAIEYEGEHHLLDPAQWDYDIKRYERLAAAGWIVVRVTKTELFGSPREFVRRVREAIRSRA